MLEFYSSCSSLSVFLRFNRFCFACTRVCVRVGISSGSSDCWFVEKGASCSRQTVLVQASLEFCSSTTLNTRENGLFLLDSLSVLDINLLSSYSLGIKWFLLVKVLI
ncbi:hypothetical protein ISN45_Aa05g009910 [Arabidopsis thaliana x Arabidopsis arenosa]|uniref:Uncharacterized protein n=1 Tax=Arabidopsis thaliana x Arabidopsis arenosa TaxID=1240361 RepID=A0A8T1ZL05_9BRAS|nr:hypothetical protein ISN45_Aa05g009910 [Arabidopsis thaliana x Arabidopsis arenosa]